MEDWTTLIELVDSTSGRRMCYLVELLDFECSRGQTARTCNMACFFTAEETIQFLSDRELFGWDVRRWSISAKWNDNEEMIIELCRRIEK